MPDRELSTKRNFQIFIWNSQIFTNRNLQILMLNKIYIFMIRKYSWTVSVFGEKKKGHQLPPLNLSHRLDIDCLLIWPCGVKAKARPVTLIARTNRASVILTFCLLFLPIQNGWVKQKASNKSRAYQYQPLWFPTKPPGCSMKQSNNSSIYF